MKVSFNRKIFYLSMTIIIFVMILTGTTTALENYKKEITLDNTETYKSSYLEINNNGSVDNNVNLEVAPMRDYEGIENANSKKFTITNTGNLPYIFNIKLLSSNSNGINSRYIKIQINDNMPFSLNLLNDSDDTYFNKVLNNYYLMPGDSMELEIRLWLDINTPNTEIGKNINLNLVTIGYADSIYRDRTIDSLEGTGTKDDPYIVSSVEDFILFSNNVNSGNNYNGKYIKLSNSIDFSNPISYANSNCYINGIYNFNDSCLKAVNFESIGNKDNPFKGNFDGDNHYIKNIPYNNSYSLFGYIDDADISNINISGNYDDNNSDTVGSIVSISNNSKITNCSSRVNYNINDLDKVYVGGIVGISNNSEINNNYNYGNINVYNVNESYVGGIIGLNRDKSISNNYNYGYVSGISNNNNYTGGIIGYGYSSINSYNLGIVSGSSNNNYLGGIVGYMDSSIDNSFNYGLILDGYYKEHKYIDTNSNNNYLGGIVGYSNSNIDKSTNHGIIKLNNGNSNYLGGISGRIDASLDNDINNGEVISNSDSIDTYLGGIVGNLGSNQRVSNSANKGNDITGISGYIGGIAGKIDNNSIINKSYNTSNISLNGNNKDISLGGIIGYVSNYGLVTETYNAGNITGNSINTGNIGGIVGKIIDNSSVNYSYNTGKVTINDIASGNIGGIIGEVNNSNIVYDYSIGRIYSNSDINIGGGIGNLNNDNNYSNKVYSLSNNANNIIGNTTSSDSLIVTESYMKSKEFLNLLNKEENKWTLNNNVNDGFPCLLELNDQ